MGVNSGKINFEQSVRATSSQRSATLLSSLRGYGQSNAVGQQSMVRNCAFCVVSWEQGWGNRRVIVPSVIIPVGPPRLKLAGALEGLKR